ncbi:MAG: cell division protein FtsA [Spirochaetia bacterium]|nr:cell division protein FtsA [Spirochaetia bacterium]
MPSDNIIVGIDIGTTKICAVIGEYNENGRLEITGIGKAPSTGLRQGVVINIEATMKAVSEAIESAEMMSGREVYSVVTGIAGGHIEGINSRGVVAVAGKGREIAPEDVSRVIDAAKAIVIPMDREVLHVIPQEFIVDDQGGIRDPLGMIGIRLESEVHIITGSVTSAQNLIKCVNRAGFRVDNIVLQSLASSKSVLRNEEKEMGVLMIDLGGGTTDVIVNHEGAPYHTDVVPVGGKQVTNDLSIVLKIPFDMAEKVKLDSGCCYAPLIEDDEDVIIPGVGGWPAAPISRRKICEIIQPRVVETLLMVKRQLDKKNYIKLLNSGVVLTGGGSLMPGITQLASEIFGMPARIGYPTGCGGMVEEFRNPMYATAVGLVMFTDEISGNFDRKVVLSNENSIVGRFKNWFREFF